MIFSVLFLIGLFLSISLYLISIGLEFIGISYLLVYVGAISILFLFILMLINIRVSELQTENNNYLPLAIFSITLLLFIFNNLLPKSYSFSSDNSLFFVTSNLWDGELINNDQISSLGNIMYTNYSIWLILVSIILLLAMTGTIVITTKSR